MPEADKEGERYAADRPQQTPGFYLKGSHQLDWGMKNRLSRIFNPETGRLKRCAAGITFCGVISHETQTTDIASGIHSGRGGLKGPENTFACEAVQIRRLRRLKRGFISQLRNRPISQSVRNNDCVFHGYAR